MMSVAGNTSIGTLSDGVVIHRRFDGTTPTGADPFSGASVVPMDQLSVADSTTLFSSSTQLVFDFDRIISTAVFNSFSSAVRKEMTTVQWCIGVMAPSNVTGSTGLRLVVERCSESA